MNLISRTLDDEQKKRLAEVKHRLCDGFGEHCAEEALRFVAHLMEKEEGRS